MREQNITVVCPTFNSAAFVIETLASVVAQDTPPREVVVVDDGSSDGTADLVEQYFAEVKPDFETKVVRAQHGGPGASRNLGVEAASLPWIAFLDSDDFWLPAKLTVVTDAIKANPEANFFCHDEVLVTHRQQRVDMTYSRRVDTTGDMIRQIYFANRFSTSAVVCRKDLLVDAGLFDTTLPSAQDYEMWLRMAADMRLVMVPESLGEYREREGNITSGRLRRRFVNECRIAFRYADEVPKWMVAAKLIRIILSYARQFVRRFVR